MSFTSSRRAASCVQAGKSWRTSWKRRATAGLTTRRRSPGADMTTTLNPFVAEAEQLASVSHQTEPAWLAEARQKALTSFNRLGFPTTRDEEWRFTSVAPIADGSFTLARQTAALTGADVEAYRWLTEPTITLVFVDGVYRQELSSL